jgi:hypothetical protein
MKLIVVHELLFMLAVHESTSCSCRLMTAWLCFMTFFCSMPHDARTELTALPQVLVACNKRRIIFIMFVMRLVPHSFWQHARCSLHDALTYLGSLLTYCTWRKQSSQSLIKLSCSCVSLYTNKLHDSRSSLCIWFAHIEATTTHEVHCCS